MSTIPALASTTVLPRAAGSLIAAKINASLSVAQQNELKEAADEIHSRLASCRNDYLAIGSQLRKVKAWLPHGAWGEWLRSEFDLSDRTAQRYMHASILFEGKSDIVSNLKPSVVYALAAPSVPEDVRVQFMSAIDRGEFPEASEVKAKATEVRRADKAIEEKVHRERKEHARALIKQSEPTEEQQRERATHAAALILDRLSEDEQKRLSDLLRKISPIYLVCALNSKLDRFTDKAIETISLD